MYTMNDAYGDVRLFNKLAGNLDNVTNASIDAQLSFCFEELSEGITAFEEGDNQNFLKEACDMFVVVSGLLQKLANAGYDVETALQRVNENNLTKFPKFLTTSQVQAADKAGFTLTYNEQHSRWVIKDAAGKVRKPAGYQDTDMMDIALGSAV